MIIILLFIPLILFIAVEGAIIYQLIDLIMKALEASSFSPETMVDDKYSALIAMVWVLGLIVVVGILIWVYMRFVIISALRDRKNKKSWEESEQNPANPINENDTAYFGDTEDGIQGNSKKNKKTKIKKENSKNKSKR